MREAWHVLEPSTPFVDGWHIKVICEHLEAVTHGKIHRLVINIPPRHAKSLIVAVFWPCWVWTQQPGTRWLFASYAQTLSIRDSLKCRRLVLSPWYQRYWGDRVKLSSDQNAKGRFENTATGYRLATSVDGVGTGEGADIVVADDPNNATEAESDLIRSTVNRWWDEAMSSRLNDPETGSFVIIQQRVHQEDLSGHVLAKGDYEHLCLPASYEPDRPAKTILGAYDRRTVADQPLWPQRFTRRSINRLARAMGPYAAAGQLQQRPAPREGGIFQYDWWGTYTPANLQMGRCSLVLQAWDTAFKEGAENDYSVCATWGVFPNGYYLLDLFREKVSFPKLKREAIAQHARWRPSVVLIEDKASGQSLLQELRADTVIPIIPVKVGPHEDKISRATSVSPIVESGKCYLPEGAPFLEAFLSEHGNFPNGAHKDIVDTTVMALRRLSSGEVGVALEEDDALPMEDVAVDPWGNPIEVDSGVRRPLIKMSQEDLEDHDLGKLLTRDPHTHRTAPTPVSVPPFGLDLSGAFFDDL